MKARAGKFIVLIVSAALFLSGLAGYSPTRAQAYPAEQQALITETSTVSFDISAATAYARKHWNDGKGFCAEFCYDILKAGGFIINGSENRLRAYTQYNYLVNELGLKSYYLGDGKITRNADKIEEGDLVLWDKSYRLKGVTSDTVSITGSGGHMVYISVANGPFSKYCAHNRARLDFILNTGDTYGLWLIKTSALAGNEELHVRDISKTEFEILVTGNVHMSPKGELHYNGDGSPVVTIRGDKVTIDKVCNTGGYTWGRIVNSGWDWIVISHDRVKEVEKGQPPQGTKSDWTCDVNVIIPGSVRSSPMGVFYYRILVAGNIRARPFGELRGNAVTEVGRIVSITDTRYEGGWLWGRLDNGGWDWIALERRDGTGKRYEYVSTVAGASYTIAEQATAGGWEWGRIAGTDYWMAIENLRTGEVRFEKIR